MLFLFTFAFSSAQDPLPPPPPPDTMAQIGQLIQAWQGKQYVLVGALVIGLIVAASKTGWFGNWLATELPPSVRPFLAVLVGILTVASTETIAGVDWKLALLHALYAAATAVLGHQMVVEGLRGGKEIMPIRPGMRMTTMPPPPPAPPADPPEGGSNTGDSGPPVLRISRRTFSWTSGLTGLLATTGCGAWWQNFQKDPVGQMTLFVDYVLGFLESAKTLWALLLPSLGDKATQANTVFVNAVATAERALTVAQDAVQEAVAAQQPTIDIAALVKPVQDAVAQIAAVIALWKSAAPSAAMGSQPDDVAHQNLQISHWQFHKN